jgi:hypothetical protein
MDRRPRKADPTLVFVVDDHDDRRELYVQGFHPDIVVTHLTMRGGDGWQLIQFCSATPEREIFPSSCSLDALHRRCANGGAYAELRKFHRVHGAMPRMLSAFPQWRRRAGRLSCATAIASSTKSPSVT